LGTGILKNTTGTGVPSIAVQSDIIALIGPGSITNSMLANSSVTNLSGTNSGDNSVNTLYSGLITNANHTGDVTGSTALTIANNVVTNSKAAQMPAGTFKANITGGSASPQDITATQAKTALGITVADVSGLSTISNPCSISTASSITTATLGSAGEGQNGRVVLIENGVSSINITSNGGVSCAYIKRGTGAITFIAGAGRTLTGANGTLILNGAVNSSASLVSSGTTDILYINNL
jgi:hypothetical protein